MKRTYRFSEIVSDDTFNVKGLVRNERLDLEDLLLMVVSTQYTRMKFINTALYLLHVCKETFEKTKWSWASRE